MGVRVRQWSGVLTRSQLRGEGAGRGEYKTGRAWQRGRGAVVTWLSGRGVYRVVDAGVQSGQRRRDGRYVYGADAGVAARR